MNSSLHEVITETVSHDVLDMSSSLGPYTGICHKVERRLNGRDLIIAIYGAYNAFGLIGPENNGIVILDDTNRLVVLDQHAQIGSGYFGPDRSQINELTRLKRLSDDELGLFISAHPRTRQW